MALPKLQTSEYQLTVPSTQEEIKYRPFLVKEQKILMIAQESGEDQQIATAIGTLVSNCTFGVMDADTAPMFDVEYVFLQLRSKSAGAKVKLMLTCPDDEETKVEAEVDLETIGVQMSVEHSQEVDITEDVTLKLRYPMLKDMKNVSINLSDFEKTLMMLHECVESVVYGEETIHRVDMTRDEKGNFILISYAQSGVRGKGPVAFKVAKEAAKMRAEGNIASFIAEAAASKKKMKETESYEQAADGTEYYKGDGAFKKDVESASKNLVISGMRQGRSWGFKHPVTKQPIVGTWVTLSSETMSSSLAREKNMNSTRPSKGSGGSGKPKGQSSKVDYGKVKKGYSGGSRKQDDDDF